jgi:amidase
MSAVEAVDEALHRVVERDPGIRAFTVVLADQARAEAAERDAALNRGEAPGPLHGVPVAIKEELDVAGCVTTFGGRGNSTPARADSEVVRRIRAAGAVVVGKTAMPEFGAWPYTESEAHGITHNPWSTGHTPGGSSGGTAAAVAAGMVPIGLGGDGGGSIRIPSAFCGLFGLKPQRGRVSAAPMEHLWWSLGTVGPLARSVLDAALVYDAIRGSQDTDLYRAGETGSFVEAARREPGRLRIGWSTRPVTMGVKPDRSHVSAVEDTAPSSRTSGTRCSRSTRATPTRPGPSSHSSSPGSAPRPTPVEHYDRLERRTREVYRLGVLGDAEGAPLRAQGDRTPVPQGEPGLRALRRPAHSGDGAPPARGGRARRHRRRAGEPAGDAGDRLRRAVEPRGNPAASVPAGIGADGLPLAIQLVGRTDDEPTLLSLAAQLEAARPWPLTAPMS